MDVTVTDDDLPWGRLHIDSVAPLSEGDDKILESAANVIFEANPDVVITSFGKGDIETDAYPVSTSGEMTTMKQLLSVTGKCESH